MPDLDEDILRQLMFRATDDLFAPPVAAGEAIKRQRRLRTRKRALSAAGTAAAAGLAAGGLASASGSAGPGGARLIQNGAASSAPAIRLTAAQQALFSLSAAAAKTPRPSGRYVVLTEQSISTYSGSGTKSSESGGKTSVIDTITGGGVTYQDITVSGSPGTPAPPGVLKAGPGTSPTVAQLDAMPADPAKLRAVLLAQAREQIRQAEQLLEQKIKKLGKLGKKIIAHQPVESADDLVFEQATDLLWEPDLSPALRSAVYKVLAATPGVAVKTGVTDTSGRPATEISRVNTVAQDNAETFLDPATGATLESAWAYPSGEFDADLYQKIIYTSTFPSDPYNG
jgi:hypothetical protein